MMTKHRRQQPHITHAAQALTGPHGSIRGHGSMATRVLASNGHGAVSPNQDCPRRTRSAFSLAEVAVSVLIVGGLLVAAFTTLGGALGGRRKIADRAVGELLAQDLMSEILRQYYREPVDTPDFGRETGEIGTSRAAYDDVDDYHGWYASPPQHKDGAVYADLTGWRREVQVRWVSPADFEQVVGAESGVKRILVTVKRNGVVVAGLTAVRTGPVESERVGFPLDSLLIKETQID